MVLLEGAQYSTAVIPVRLRALPDAEEALRYLGYAGQAMDERLADRLEAAVKLCGQFRPTGAFRVFDLDESPDGKSLQAVSGGLLLRSESLSSHVGSAVGIALMAVTLGLESERVLRREMALSPTDGMLANAAASSMAEAAMEALQQRVAEWAQGRGLRVGQRFSPGYGDLGLDVQPLLLERLNAARLLGVTTTDAHLLVPSKSITAIAGLYEYNGRRDDSPNSACVKTTDCETCSMAQACLLRQQGRTCRGGRS